MTTPIVSVGLPVHNGARFLQQALDSLRTQDLADIEIVISDNGSDDATQEICRAAAAEDRRIRYVRHERNRGAAWNYRAVFHAAAARYFKWAAHDDVCRPSFLRRCVESLEAERRAVVAYPRTEVIDDGGRVVGPHHDGLHLVAGAPHERLAALLAAGPEYHPIFGVIRRDALARTRVMGSYVGADIVTLAELAVQGLVVELPAPLFLRRIHDGTSVRANPDPLARGRWFDPARSRPSMPATRLSFELLAAVSRARVTAAEQRRCVGVVLRDWVAPKWRDVGGEVKSSLRRRIAA